MNLTYNKHISKFKSVHHTKDLKHILEEIKQLTISYPGIMMVKGKSGKEWFEIEKFNYANTEDQKKLLIYLGDMYKITHNDANLEVIIKIPTKDHKDKNDKNTLSWGGERASARMPDHAMRRAPMFFRRDGSELDIVNMYKDQSVFMICNGPSFANLNHGRLKLPGIITFGINNGAHVFRPNLWTSVDDPTRFLRSIWADSNIQKFIPMAHFEKPIWDTELDNYSTNIVGDFANVVGFRRNERFVAKEWLYQDTINWGNHKDYGGGRSVFLAAIKICYLLGFKNLYLLGCDFTMSDTQKYWFDENRTEQAVKNNNSSYQSMIRYFHELAPTFKQEGFNIYNCNPESGLKIFPFVDYTKAVLSCVVDTSAKTKGMYINRKKEMEAKEKRSSESSSPEQEEGDD